MTGTKEQRLHLGVKMIEYLSKLGLIKHQNRKLNKFKTITYVEATRKIIDEIRNNIKNEALTTEVSSNANATKKVGV